MKPMKIIYNQYINLSLIKLKGNRYKNTNSPKYTKLIILIGKVTEMDKIVFFIKEYR